MDKEKIKKKLVGTLSFTAIKLRKKIFKNKNMRSINVSFRPARELEKCRSSKPESTVLKVNKKFCFY